MKFFTRIILVLFLTVTAFSAKAAVVAGFTASPTSGCSPLVVYFTNTSSGATSYKWDFGNGTPYSYLVSPSSSYLSPGTYTITLVAYDGKGDSSVTTATITVYPPPTVSFTVSDTAVCPGTPITFTSTTVGGVPGALSYVWAFGDGDTSSAASPSHSYAASGYYNVTLTVTNAKGCVASFTMFRYIHVFTPATVSFKAAVTYFCKAPGHAVFTNLTTGTPGFTYLWRFGDGSTSTATDPTHDYTATGSYDVTLIVTDGNGCIDSIVWPAYIHVGNLKASFVSVDTACVNSTVSFKNTSSSHISSSWTYGDGGSDATDDGSHAYSVAGTYSVRLIVFDGTCYDTFVRKIVILPGPIVSFTQNPLHPCPPPVGITFTATTPSGTSVSWDFGDGTSGSGTPVTHFYSTDGVYKITMTVTDPKTGCVSIATRTDTLYDMVFNVGALPKDGCVPLTVNFSSTEQTDDPRVPPLSLYPYPWPVSSYSWTFGDGGTSTGATPSHTYTAEGIYMAYLTITTSNGCVFTDSIRIEVGAPPIITVTAIPTHLCYNQTDTFLVTIVKGPVDDFHWLFGDGTILDATALIQGHKFVLPGLFTVTVTPYYRGCPGPPFIVPTPIRVDSPKAGIGFKVLCSPSKRVVFTDLSMGDDSRVWIFGDGTTDTSKNPIHDYPLPTTYTIELTTYNKTSGCRDTAYVSVNLSKPIPDFTASRPFICIDAVDTFTPTITGGTASWYGWSSKGISADSEAYSYLAYVDTFHTSGPQTVRLVIMDQNGCLDTVVKTNIITVAHPNVNFIASPTSGCWPLTVTFTDKSTDAPGVTLTNYAWGYGDGGTSSGPSTSVKHTFTSAGTFNTKEIVTDNIGCIDSVTLPLVTVYRPHAVFAASNTFPCSGDSVLFTNTSTGIVSSYWTFGDGTSSTVTSPWHTYPGPGFYTVTLAVTDAHGCSDTAVYTSYIFVSAPVAAFTMSDSFAICPPLTVNFINTSTGAIGYGWTFGDGSSSSLSNPSDLYITTGYFTVILTAVNMYGCTATAIGHVNIFGSSGTFSYAPLNGCVPLTVHFSALISNVPTIIWDFNDGNTSAVSFSDTIDHVYTLPGEYVPKLILSDGTGCQSSSLGKDTIKIDAVTPGFTSIPNPICVGNFVNFKDTSSSFWSTITGWRWQFTNGDTSNLSAPPYFYNTAGTYPVNLTVTDGWGCKADITENVIVFPPAQIIASPDTTVCLTDKATLTGYGGVKYVWSPPATLSCTSCNPTFATPDVITTYTVTGTDQNGCINFDTVSVFLKYKTVSASHGDTAVCQGIAVPLFDSGATKFTWVPSLGLSSAFIANPWATPPVTTTYGVIAQLAGCIPDTNYVTVVVHPLPTVDAGQGQTLVEGSTAQLNAIGTNIDYYSWDESNSLSCDSCPNPVASMSVTTTYRVNVYTKFGCTAADTVTIHIFCDKSQLFIPNTFTPNGDGQNDVFYPRGKGVRDIKSFRIYNRWGQLLFERTNIGVNDASNAWDGSYLGGSPRPDVYVYIIDAICETGAPINIKGDVTIIR